MSSFDDDESASAANWSPNAPDSDDFESSEPLKSNLVTLQHPDANLTPTMRKKVSFAAEVDEQQEKMSKDNSRRDVCCSIQ